jgi:hypothetical protein
MMTGAEERAAVEKVATVRREITLYELVLPDLQQMEASGKFDRNVLLWLQDGYVSRAMKENAGELVAFHRELAGQDDMTQDERWAKQTEFLTKITKETYSTAKFEGGGVDLKNYVDAARTFYEAESTLYAGHLGELAEYIKKSLEAGVKPDLERFAREAYVSMARMSGAITNLEGMGSRAGAHDVAQAMKRGIEAINYTVVSSPGSNIQIGRELLTIVNEIGKSPDRYVEYVESYKLSARSAPFDFETARRGADPAPSM